MSVPATPRPGVLPFSAVKAAEPFEHNASATLWDAGDGVAVLEFHTKANAIDDDVLEVLELTVAAGRGPVPRGGRSTTRAGSSAPAATSGTS